jgi:hypothetical protein
MANNEMRLIAAQILRASRELFSDVRLNTPGLTHAEPHAAEKDLARFISERAPKGLSPRDAAAFAFRVVLAVLKTQKLEDGFALEIDDDAVLPPAPAHKTMKGAA